MKREEILLNLLMMLALCCRFIQAQDVNMGDATKRQRCPKGMVGSKWVPNQCVSASRLFCDGWVFIDKPEVCITLNPRVAPQYGKASVNCQLSIIENEDGSGSLFQCVNCPAKTPFGFQCTGCKEDEYYSFYQKVGCIKKQDYGLPPYNYGIISESGDSIISSCEKGQQIIDYPVITTSGKSLLLKKCSNCPIGQKSSQLVNGQCLVNGACDGYLFRNTTQCLDRNPSIYPQQYGKPIIDCSLSKDKDALSSLYICRNCTDPLKPVGQDCTACQEDEYIYFIESPIKCIKKINFGISPYSTGYVSEDYKAIIPKCNAEQIIIDHTILLQNNTILTQKRCSRRDMGVCFTEEVKDLRQQNQKLCIKWWTCNLLSSDYQQCVNQCEAGEIIEEISQAIKICKPCTGNSPFVSLDKKICVSDCGLGNVYNEEKKVCIPLNECTEFVNKGICSKKDCTIRENPQIRPDAVLVKSPSGTKYKLCNECPETAPFFMKVFYQSCGDCTEDIHNSDDDGRNRGEYIITKYNNIIGCTRKYIDTKDIKGNLSYDKKIIYNLGYCPTGFIQESKGSYNECIPCPNKNYSNQSQRNTCCLDGQFFDTINLKCIDTCNLVQSDFTCNPKITNDKLSCKNGEIIISSSYTYKDSLGQDVNKQINQCVPCNDSRVKLSDLTKIPLDSQINLKKCFILFFSQNPSVDYQKFVYPNIQTSRLESFQQKDLNTESNWSKDSQAENQDHYENSSNDNQFSTIEIAVISIGAFILIQCVIFGIYQIIKRQRSKKLNKNQQVNSEVEKVQMREGIIHTYNGQKVDSLTTLKDNDDEIESKLPQKANTVEKITYS